MPLYKENWQRSYKIVFGTPEYIKEAYIVEEGGGTVLRNEFTTVVDAETIPSNALEMSVAVLNVSLGCPQTVLRVSLVT